MKLTLMLVLLLFLVAGCAPAMLPLPAPMPVGTIVALTMQAIPKPTTPTPPILDAPILTDPPDLNPIQSETATMPVTLNASGASCLPAGERMNARVSRVIDGNTIEVAVDNLAYTVRYIGVGAPSTTRISLSLLATGRNRDLVEGQVVSLVKDAADLDAEGHWLRYVLVGNTLVNYLLIKEGYARSDPQPPDIACQKLFDDAQFEAQGNQLGYWAPTPMPTKPAIAQTQAAYTPVALVPYTKEAPCNCEAKRTQRCKSFDTHAEAQACFNYCVSQGYGDVFNLDKDGSGSVCRGLP
jgi:endonuclease YncB( thermonuclease family)